MNNSLRKSRRRKSRGNSNLSLFNQMGNAQSREARKIAYQAALAVLG